MILARVVGNLVATVKTPSHEGEKILVVEPVDPDGKPQGGTFLAVDRGRAGPGDIVLIVQEGNSCRQIVGKNDGAIDAAIVGFVDHIEGGGVKLNPSPSKN